MFWRAISHAGRSYNVRFSPRFLNPMNDKWEEELQKKPSILLRKACKLPLHRGIQPPPVTDEEDEDIAFVIGVTELKNSYIDFKSARHVPLKFYDQHRREAGLCEDDLLIASTGATIGKVDIFDRNDPAIANNHVTIARLDKSRFNPYFTLALLRHSLFQFQIERDRSGSAQPEIYPNELSAMRFPVIAKPTQDDIANRIIPIESSIKAARSKLRQPVDIINEILCATFGYPLSEHQERERERVFTRKLADFGTGFTLRGSVKFHHPDYELTDDFFAHASHKRLKVYLAVPIRLGVSLTREGMDDQGEAFYVHPNALRSQERIDLNDCHRVTMDFYEGNKRRSSLRVGDVLIARSGEGTIGKVALFDLDEPCIFSDFTMRLRFNDTMNPEFAVYFFRSIMFQSQVEREKRGMGNMTNIFPSQVERFLTVECSRAQQDKLAVEIATELDTLEKERKKIEAGRQEIQRLVEETITQVRTVW